MPFYKGSWSMGIGTQGCGEGTLLVCQHDSGSILHPEMRCAFEHKLPAWSSVAPKSFEVQQETHPVSLPFTSPNP